VNLLLLDAAAFLDDGTAEVTGRAARHLSEVLRARAGDVVRVGRADGDVGSAEVLRCEPDSALLRVRLEAPPPPRPLVDVLLALPRPKALRRLFASAAALGVDRLVLLNAARVEKSYFDSPVLGPTRMAAALRDGLEQARDTLAPEVHIFRRFRPFVEDQLEALLGPGTRLLLEPGAAVTAPEVPAQGRVALAIGPEGGWVAFERELLAERGFVATSFGPRTLRVESVLSFSLGWLLGSRLTTPRRGKVSSSLPR
jgi:RsmE family RNA methyltransferase